MNIGFIGLGIMGCPMAAHALAGDRSLRVFSRTRAKAEPLLAAGARWCDSPASCARDVELLCLNVTDSPDVEGVLFGADGAAETLGPGAVVVDFSTIDPLAAARFAAILAEKGIAFLDAPVTGGQVGAQNATLTIMVGGNAAAFERVRPVLELVGKKIVHVGPSGSGQALKACNQVLCAVNMIGVCEGLMLAQRSGLDLGQALETLGTGAGGSWAWSVLGAKIAAGDFQPAFMIKLMQKDLRIAQEAAQRLGIPMPGAALAQQLLRAVEGTPGGAELGTQAMIRAFAGSSTFGPRESSN